MQHTWSQFYAHVRALGSAAADLPQTLGPRAFAAV